MLRQSRTRMIKYMMNIRSFLDTVTLRATRRTTRAMVIQMP